MSEAIHAIETIYDGHRFRSRLEARWAVFFNELGIEYEYEVEGFYLDGTCYLPDFYLPAFECYVEIKRSDAISLSAKNNLIIKDEDDNNKNMLFTEALCEDKIEKADYLLFFSGDPYNCFFERPGQCGLVSGLGYISSFDGTTLKTDWFNNQLFAHAQVMGLILSSNPPDYTENIYTWVFAAPDKKKDDLIFGIRGKHLISTDHMRCQINPRRNGIPAFGSVVYFPKGDKDPIMQAAIRARQARFEHGETPEVTSIDGHQ